jgi:RNA polymerase-binding transcription factor DksA
MSGKAGKRHSSVTQRPPPSESRQKENLRVIRHRTGLEIQQTGIYRVHHDNHRLPHEVTLLKGESFPRCSQCGSAVEFELLKAAPEIDLAAGFRVVLYELPSQDDTEEKANAESA